MKAVENASPVIGLSARTLALQAARQTRPTETVARSYIEPLERAGALVLLLPNAAEERAGAYLDLIDGLMLTGGDDPHPHLFGEEPHAKIEVVDERRDRFEIALCLGAREREMPLLAICRGVQLLNIARGGDIYQDISSQTDSTVGHSQQRTDDGPWHKVAVREGSLLADLLAGPEFAVNSFHHQACRRVGDGLEICATSPEDGLIEALEDPGQPFCLGVQWHPELDPDGGPPFFASFVEAARQAKSSKKKRTALSGR